ncbi:cation:proton antiporter [Opitutales bacterium ASA1]|uniref:cation:proton antiporter domain-containing protein n=1 Tax=Congregicoccus parvus TaxID=3081749 RepID=UPI002B2E45A0|nr:cation:proton antiporter [Opitutales bacterium ASA1]
MPEAAKFIQDLAVIMIAAACGGLLCKRIGLSPIVGYLAAGIIVGPFTPPYSFVEDIERVHVLAQLGLVFLMFGIGLGFSISRIKQLGFPVLIATAGTAFFVFNTARVGGGLVGLDRVGSIFFAGMLLSSSSAVIGKILSESGRTHEKSSQLALGITLSEDMVAIVMLTLLGSYVQFGTEPAGDGSGGRVLETLALFGGFVLTLAAVGLLIVPRVLRRLSREANAELETIFVAALLFGLSMMVVKSGYSLALGAFLLGAIIGETPQRAHVERAFSGLRDFFAAIFFVAIGMTIEVARMGDALWPIVALSVLALVGRPILAALMLLLIGHDSRMALRAGLILAPLGEFGFIVAQLGTAHALLPPEYMSAAVGASLITALVSPVMVKYNGAIADKLGARDIPLIGRALDAHRRVLDALHHHSSSNLLWRLSRKRLFQIGREVAFISVALAFAGPVIAWIVRQVGTEVVPGAPTAVVCWVTLGFLLLVPLVAVWRNTQALAMIIADYIGHTAPALARIAPFVSTAFQILVSLALVLLWSNFVPAGAGLWLTTGVLVFLAVMAAVLWRRMIRWHSNIEYALNTSLGDANDSPSISYEWMDRYSPWGLEVGEVTVPDQSACAGRSIGDIGIRKRFGCTVIGIERQTFMVANPGPTSHLFPGDRVLLLGTAEQITAARAALMEEQAAGSAEDTFRDLAVELLDVPHGSPACGRTLAALNWPRLLGVQIVGHERDGVRTLTPPADLRLAAGDDILALGTPGQIGVLRHALEAPQPAHAPSSADG